MAEVQKKVSHFEKLQEKIASDVAEKEIEIQKAQTQMMQTQQELEKYQKSTKELLSELREQYVDLMQEQANVGNELKYLERQYLQETSRSKQTLAKQSEVEASVIELSSQQQVLSEKQAHLQLTLSQNKNELEEVQANGKKIQGKLTN